MLQRCYLFVLSLLFVFYKTEEYVTKQQRIGKETTMKQQRNDNEMAEKQQRNSNEMVEK
jgi:hypothetical protein